MTRSRFFLWLVLLLFGVFAGLLYWSTAATKQFQAGELANRRQLVRVLMLTDLALWTEARYTRHPAMADLFSPFQDHPGALEHFPAGSLVAPAVPSAATTLVIRRRGDQ